MKAVVVRFQIKSPINLFSFLLFKFHIVIKLQNSTCIALKRRGYGFGNHYIMTLWRNKKEIQEFNNDNTKLLSNSVKILKEVKILSFEAFELPNWKEVIILLENKAEKVN